MNPIDYLSSKTDLPAKEAFRAREIFAQEIIKAWEAGVKEQYEFQQGRFETFGMEGEFPHKADVSLSGENYYRNTYKN